MKETDFIKQNKKKWARFEKLSSNKNNDPDEVSELFTEITEDLSYARTFYPRRSVRVYLNQLSQGVFTSLYKQRKQPLGNFARFWTQTVPLEVYRARYNMLTAFLFFLLAVVIGAVSQEYDANFVRIILGDFYVDMTEERIAEGNPMGIYGESAEGSMFFMITINNIQVAFMAFTMGIFATIGTYWILLKNGIMLGAFQWWFKAKGLLFTTFLAIWIHGAFEISAIVIAGAAGLTVGNGLIFPKSYSRVQSLVFTAKRGLIIMLSLVPFFIMAGALESFVTRHYRELHTGVKLLIILGSFAIILFYYVVYPFIVARRHPDKIELKEIPRFIPQRKITWYKIRKPGEIFTDTFTLVIGKMSQLSRIFFNIVFPVAAALVALIFVLEYYSFDYIMDWYEIFGVLFGTDHNFTWYKFLGWPLPLALLIGAAYFVFNRENDENLLGSYLRFIAKPLIWVYLYALLLFTILVFSPGPLLIFVLLVSPFLMAIPSLILMEGLDFFTAFAQSFNLMGKNYGDALVSFMGLVGIIIIFFFILHNPFELGLVFLIDDFLRDIFITTVDSYRALIAIVNTVIYLMYFFLVISIGMIAFALNYYTAKEKNTATGMFDRLEKFGKRNKNFETDLDFE